MKELLIKIKALFEGSGAQQAKQAITDVDRAADKAAGSTSKLGTGMGQVDSKAAGFAGVMAGASAAITTFAIDLAQKAVTALIDFGKALAQGILEIANFAGSMTDLASRTGQTVADVTVLQQAFKNAGMSADAVGPTLNKLQKAIQDAGGGTGPAAEAFARLKINLDEFRQLTAVEQLDVLAERISLLPDPAARAGTAMDIMGRSAGQMLTMFSDSQSIETARTQIGSLAGNLEKSGAALDAFSDSMAALETKKMQFFAGVASQFADDLQAAGVYLDKLDVGPLGEQLGIVLRGVIETGKELRAWAQWVKEFTDALNLTGPLIDGIKQGLLNALGPAGMLLEHFYDTGSAAVEADAAQAQVTAELEESAARAQLLIDKMRENERLAYGAIEGIQQAGETGVTTTADTAGAEITQGGENARAGIDAASAVGKAEIQLTAQQIHEAAVQLASAFQTGMGQSISPALQALVNAVQASLQQMAAEITSISQSVATSNQQTQTSLQAVSTTLQQTVAAVQATTTQLQSQIQTVATQSATMAQQAAQNSTTLQQTLTTALQTLTTTITQNNTSLLTMLQTQQQQLATSLQGIVERFTATQSQAAQVIPQAFQTLTQTIATTNQQIAQSVQSAIQSIGQNLGQMQSSIVSGFQQLANSVSQSNQAINSGLEQIGASVSQGISQIGTTVSQNVSKIGSAVTTAMSGVGTALSSLGSSITAAINRLQQMIQAVAARIR